METQKFIEQVRALIGDDDTADPTFSDAQITVLQELFADNPYLAGASLLERLAVEEALLYKYVKSYDMTIDGTKAADVVLERAKRLRAENASNVVNEGLDMFTIVDTHSYDPWLEYTWRPL